MIRLGQFRRHVLTFVTRRVARSSLSPYLDPPMRSPAAPAAPLSPRSAGGT
jgi:hypothetical protein